MLAMGTMHVLSSFFALLFMDIISIWTSAHGEASVRLVMIYISICMLFLLCNPGRPFLSRAFMILRSSALAVDEDGIENDGVSFRLGT